MSHITEALIKELARNYEEDPQAYKTSAYQSASDIADEVVSGLISEAESLKNDEWGIGEIAAVCLKALNGDDIEVLAKAIDVIEKG